MLGLTELEMRFSRQEPDILSGRQKFKSLFSALLNASDTMRTSHSSMGTICNGPRSYVKTFQVLCGVKPPARNILKGIAARDGNSYVDWRPISSIPDNSATFFMTNMMPGCNVTFPTWFSDAIEVFGGFLGFRENPIRAIDKSNLSSAHVSSCM